MSILEKSEKHHQFHQISLLVKNSKIEFGVIIKVKKENITDCALNFINAMQFSSNISVNGKIGDNRWCWGNRSLEYRPKYKKITIFGDYDVIRGPQKWKIFLKSVIFISYHLNLSYTWLLQQYFIYTTLDQIYCTLAMLIYPLKVGLRIDHPKSAVNVSEKDVITLNPLTDILRMSNHQKNQF